MRVFLYWTLDWGEGCPLELCLGKVDDFGANSTVRDAMKIFHGIISPFDSPHTYHLLHLPGNNWNACSRPAHTFVFRRAGDSSTRRLPSVVRPEKEFVTLSALVRHNAPTGDPLSPGNGRSARRTSR